MEAGPTNSYTYTYKSQKPYKTLPEAQTVRVYDKVPIRAKAQDIVGNRVIYGNFISKSTPPASINYNLAVTKKTDSFTSWAEYPNHTLKQNRNYQAGIVLADKFGRQSTVILSSNDIGQSLLYNLVGSTIYSQYYIESDNLHVKNWRGNTLAMIVNSPIVSSINEGTGTPGLYAIPTSANGFTLQNPSTTTITDTSYTFTISAGISPAVGDFLRGQYTDYVKVLTKTPDPLLYGVACTITTSGRVNDVYARNTQNDPTDIKYAYSLNQLGWYSYKIVVRQQQQEYYNVYLPGMLNGYPMFQTSSPGNPTIFPLNEENKTAHTVLLNDNINKIPRDLTEVGPDQKQYRSSVELFGRVENLLDTVAPYYAINKQYYPAKKADIASTIASSSDLNFLPTNSTDNVNGTASNNFYQLSTTPIIARISTVNKIGVIASDLLAAAPPVAADTMNPFLSVYETAPFVSLLDIFWETSSSGLISDLNADVLTGSDIAVGFDNLIFNHREFQDPAGIGTPLTYGTQTSPYITGYFLPINNLGVTMTVDSMSMTVVDLTGANRSSDFELIKETTGLYAGKFAIKIKNPFVFLINAGLKENYIFTFNIIDTTNGNATLTATNSLNNSLPVITYPTYQSPVEVFNIDNLIVGPIISCSGTNGAPVVALDPSFNTQQLQWSIYSSTPGFSTYFSIDPVTGVISLTNITVPMGVNFNTTIRLTDAYNFTTNAAGTGSLYSERNITLYVPIANNYCADWNSVVTTSGGIPPTQVNTVTGQLNFWRVMQVGETIDVSNSDVEVIGYTVSGAVFYATNPGTGNLTFSTSDFYGTFGFTVDQGVDVNSVDTLYITGNLITSLGRIIPIDIQNQYTISSPPSSSSNNSCTTYIPTATKKWKLTNDNPTTSINWQALLDDEITIIGGVLTPGNFVGSTFYSGTYTCIIDTSLTYGSGGTAIINPC